jgi:hypothetical protein
MVPKNCLITVRSILSKTAQGPFETLFAAYKDFLKLWKDADPDPHPEANQSVVREAAIVVRARGQR